MQFGLSGHVINQVMSVFATIPKIKRVLVFGSRALERHREGSDIDLAIEGENLSLVDVLDVRVKLEDLELPYEFDVVVLDDSVEPELRNHIDRAGRELYSRSVQ